MLQTGEVKYQRRKLRVRADIYIKTHLSGLPIFVEYDNRSPMTTIDGIVIYTLCWLLLWRMI